MQNADSSAFMKGPKRKRLAKACDACHKSKRRCDGTAPCSNCYYASKQCTYTDASGRPVPAPRPFKPERQDPQPSSSTSDSRSYPTSQFNQPSVNQFRIYPNPPPPPPPFQNDTGDDDHKHARKRFRNERGNPMPVDDLIIDGPVSMDRPTSIDLDPSLTRELTNLFFTHCHPARLVIHKPTFSSSLSHNRVPSHLLLAVCALAAPLSKQPRIRTTPARFAGKPFAQEALSQMFDGAGRLVVEPDLAAAQALCVLQMHDILTKERNTIWSSRFHDLALQIVEGLGVHSPEHPTLTPVPSQEFVQRAIEREAIRRIFWLIHFLDVMASIYFKKPVTFADVELRLRLPVDETSFELGVHSTLPEYLYLPAVRTQYASEFGHLIRIISIYAKMECTLDEVNDAETTVLSSATLIDAEQKMDEWDRTLPDHLRFSEQSLLVQQSMFETSSNGGAWCWCSMHVYHASCALVLNLARQRTQRKGELQWALERIELILQMLGDRAKNSILMGAALWSLVKYCKRDDAQVRKWSADYEEAYGSKIQDLVQDWRSHPSPPQQHNPGPSHSHSHSQHQPQLQQLPHGGSYHAPHQQQHQQQHRRISDVRSSGNQGGFAHNSWPPQHAVDAYGGSSTAVIMKRSPSNSPPISYPLGRPPNSNNTSGNINPNRSMGTNQQHPSDSSGGSGGRERAGQVSSVNSASSCTGSVGSVGPGLGHGNGGGDSSAQNQQQAGKYDGSGGGSGREGNASAHARWSHSGGELVGGGGGEGGGSAIQAGSYSGSGGGPSGSGLSGDVKMVGGGSGGNGSGASGSSGQRVFADGNQLPSLKASGLLDSWGSASRDPQKQVLNTAAPQQQPQPLHISPRRNTPPVGMSLSLMAPALHADATELRPSTTIVMPVGLPWLANESR